MPLPLPHQPLETHHCSVFPATSYLYKSHDEARNDREPASDHPLSIEAYHVERVIRELFIIQELSLSCYAYYAAAASPAAIPFASTEADEAIAYVGVAEPASCHAARRGKMALNTAGICG